MTAVMLHFVAVTVGRNCVREDIRRIRKSRKQKPHKASALFLKCVIKLISVVK